MAYSITYHRCRIGCVNGFSLYLWQENAEEAGVDDCIVFRRADVKILKPNGSNGIIITNPPYGERIGEKEDIEKIYKHLGRFFAENPDWSLFLITSDKELEKKVMGRKAERRRKLYNGHLEVCYYQFHGVRQQGERLAGKNDKIKKEK